jgi:hypothetical protein
MKGRPRVDFKAAMTGMAALLVYPLCLVAVSIATLIQARGERIYAILFAVVGLFAVVLVLVATVVHTRFSRR